MLDCIDVDGCGSGRGEDDGDGDVKQDFCVLVKIVHVTRGAFKNGDAYYDGTVANVAKILKIQPIRIGRVLIFYDVIYHTLRSIEANVL